MTEELAKQKVRETHPAAFRSAKGTVWSEHGMTKVRLGKNWQNAAESLPAAPEQETDEKDDAWKSMVESILPEPVAGVLSHEEHRRACMFNLPAAVFGSSPKVAPDQCGANLGMYECRLDYGHPNDHDDQGVKWLNSFNVAEPKPTPSTQRPGFCRHGICTTDERTLKCSLCLSFGYKPQPGSSSIPALKPLAAFPKPKDFQVFPKSDAEKIAIREKRFGLDGGRCVDCTAPVILERGHWNSMHLMHIKSKGSGGDWSMENLATGCLYCHAKRHNAGGKPVPSKRRIL